jgi:outer membrane protein assembly factor BamB
MGDGWGRNRVARLVPWILPVLVVGALQLVAVSAVRSGSETKEVDRWFPRTAGTTWLYSSRSGGEDAGTHVVQVVGAGRTADGTATVLEGRWDNLFGRGPARQFQYQGVTDDRLVLHGQRFGGSYTSYDPPQPQWERGLTPGGSFTWTGTVGTEEQRLTTTFEGEEPLTVAGASVEGCRHYRTATVVTTAAGEVERTYESWLCPDIGAVRTVERAPDLGFVLEEELIGFRSAGRRLGTVAPPSPAAVIGEAPGDVDLGRVAWSDNRKQLVKFPPIGGEDLLVLAEHEGTVSATRTSTGRVLWRVAVADPVPAGPVLSGPYVVVAGADKTLSALDAESGLTHWSVRLPDVAAVTPLVTGDTVVVAGQDRRVRAFGLADGSPRWETATGDIPASPPAPAGGLVVVADKAGGVAALRLSDGEVQWSTAPERQWAAGPAPAGDDTIVVDRAGIVSAFDSASGDLTWSRYIELDVEAPVVVTEDLVLLVPNGDRLRALDRRDGSSRWQVRLDGETSVAPVVAGDDVVVALSDGRLQRRALADGSLVEAVDPGPPTPASAVRVEVPPVWIGSQLVVTRDLDLPWPRTDLLAFGPPAGAAGVRLTGELRRTEGLISGVPRLSGTSLLLPGADQTVKVLPPSGDTRTLLTSDASVPYAIPAGDLVLAPRGQELVAVPVAGGDPRWSLPAGAPMNGTEPVVAGDTVITPIAGAGVASVDLGTGRPRWVHPITAAEGTGAPVVLPGGDVLYAVGGLVRLDGATGRPRWSVPGVTVFGPIAVVGGAVVAAVVTDTSSALLAVDLATGAERWRRPFIPAPLVGPSGAGDVVVAVDAGGNTVALDAGTGRPLWAYAMRTGPSATPVILGDRVVLSEAGREEDLHSRETRLTVHDLRTGRYLAALEPPGFAFLKGTFGSTSGSVVVPVGTGVMILRPQ